MTDTKIETGTRYVGEALAAIVRLLLPGDRVRAEFGPDLIIEGPLRADIVGHLRVGPRCVHLVGDGVHDDDLADLAAPTTTLTALTALTVLSLAPRPDPEPWWAGAEAVMDKDGAVWQYDRKVDLYDRWGEASTADDLETDYGPCTPIRQGGRTILSEAEIGAVVAEVVLHGRTVGHVLTELHGWRP